VLAATSLARRLLPEAGPADRAVAAAIGTLALATSAATGLAASGALARPTVIVAGDLLGIAGLVLWPRAAPGTAPHGRRGAAAPFLVAAVMAWIASPLLTEWRHPPRAWDALAYHLHFALRFLRSGSWAPVAVAHGDLTVPFFPFGGDLLFSWALAPLDRSDFFARFASLPFGVLAPLLLYRWCRALGTPPLAAALAVVAVSLCPFLRFEWYLGEEAQGVDLLFAFELLACASFVSLLDRSRGAPVLVGLSAGLAVGTKPFGALMALAPVLWATVQLAGGPDRWRRLASLWAPLLLLGLPCFVRNLLWTGNPVYPIQVEAGSRTLFPGPVSYEEFRTAFHASGGFPVPVFFAANWAYGGLWPALSTLWLVAALLLLGPFRRRVGGGPRLLWPVLFPVSVAACGLLLPERHPRFFYAGVLGTVPALALALGVVVRSDPWETRLPALGTRALRAVGAVLAVLALALVPGSIRTYEAERQARWADFRYVFFAKNLPLGEGWASLARRVPPGSRVAYCGMTPPYALAGPGLRNDVRYVPPAPGPVVRGRAVPPVRRAPGDADEWARRVREEACDYVMVSIGGEGFPAERAWADQAFPLIDSGETFRLYAVGQGRR
jgi:hypothetical protein